MRKTLWLVTSGALLILASAAPAVQAQTCTDNTLPLQCNGLIDFQTFEAIQQGAAFLRIQANDPAPINAGGDVALRVCDVGTLNDKFGAILMRQTAPRFIDRCVTPTGGSCEATAVPKGGAATQDVLLGVVEVVREDVAQPGVANAAFQVNASGFNTLQVSVLDTTPGTVVAMPAGNGCPEPPGGGGCPCCSQCCFGCGGCNCCFSGC